jgi:hypothetical protein
MSYMGPLTLAGFQASPMAALPAKYTMEDFRVPAIRRAPLPVSKGFLATLQRAAEASIQSTPFVALLTDQPWAPHQGGSSRWRTRWFTSPPPHDASRSVRENLEMLEAFAPELFDASLPRKQLEDCTVVPP